MQSYNNPDPASLLDVSFSDLLNAVIGPEDVEEANRLLAENWDPMGDQLNSTGGAGMLQVQTGQMVSMGPSGQLTSPTQNNTQVISGQPLLMTQMVSIGKVMQLTSMKQMVALGQIVQTASPAQSGQTGLTYQYVSSA